MASYRPHEVGPLTPTFGIELEFVLLAAKEGSSKSTEVVLLDLLRKPIHDHCSLPGCTFVHQVYLPLSNDASRSDQWTVDKDNTVMLTDEQKWCLQDIDDSIIVHPCEVRSPAFFYHDRLSTNLILTDATARAAHEPYLSPAWQIEHVLQLIASANKPHKQNGILRTFVNSTAGFHVHVGQARSASTSPIPSQGFSIGAVKKILGLSTIFERQLDSMHETQRIVGSTLSLQFAKATNDDMVNIRATGAQIPGESTAYCMPLSWHHSSRACASLKSAMDPERDYAADAQSDDDVYPDNRYPSVPTLHANALQMNSRAWDEMTQGAQTLSDCLNLYRISLAKFSTVSLRHLTAGPSHKKTIEFRQHAATLSYPDIINFVHVAVGLTIWCSQADDATYQSLVYGKWCDLDFTLPDLLLYLGIEQSAINHYGMIATNDGESYAKQLYNTAMNVENEHDSGDTLTELIAMVEADNLEAREYEAVAARVKLKLLGGGYGLYPRSALSGVADSEDKTAMAGAYESQNASANTLAAEDEDDEDDEPNDSSSDDQDVEMQDAAPEDMFEGWETQA